MTLIVEEIKRIARECTTDVILKVTSAMYDEIVLKLRRLENTVETLQHENRDLKAEVAKLRKRHNKRKHDKVEESTQTQNSVEESTKKKRKTVYYSWNERMDHLLQLESLRWTKDNVIEIDKDAVVELFPSENKGKSIFQFKRIYGKDGDKTRFDITCKAKKIKMTHRCLKKDAILKIYGSNDSDIEDFPMLSGKELENLLGV